VSGHHGKKVLNSRGRSGSFGGVMAEDKRAGRRKFLFDLGIVATGVATSSALSACGGGDDNCSCGEPGNPQGGSSGTGGATNAGGASSGVGSGGTGIPRGVRGDRHPAGDVPVHRGARPYGRLDGTVGRNDHRCRTENRGARRRNQVPSSFTIFIHPPSLYQPVVIPP